MLIGTKKFVALVAEIGAPLGVSVEDVRSTSRRLDISAVRSMVIHECRDRHGLSIKRIAALAHKDRTSVRHALSKSKASMKEVIAFETLVTDRLKARELQVADLRRRGYRPLSPQRSAARKVELHRQRVCANSSGEQ